VKIFFDNCTAPVFAETLNAFLRRDGHSAHHIGSIRDLPNGRSSKDIEWIDFLRRSPDVWIFVTGDGRVTKNPAERAALRGAGLHGFVLAPAYQTTPFNQVAATLIWKWPELLKITDLLSPPTMHEIPIRTGTKLRQLPF
jgi:hypothetical protein